MKLTRTEKKDCIRIFKLVLNKLKNYSNSPFICNYIDEIVYGEENKVNSKVRRYFMTQRPSKEQHTKFYKHSMCIQGSTVWWKVYINEKLADKSYTNIKHKQRQLFLKYLIGILKKELLNPKL